MAVPTVLYAPAIQEAMASGDLRKMKLLVREADKQLELSREVKAGLEKLKAQIARLERGGRR